MWALIATVLLLRGPAIYSSCGLNKCGNWHLKNIIQPFGIPFVRHLETEAGRISHKRATALVPPRESIISEHSDIRQMLALTNMGCQPNETYIGT
jgi:hypothetical protein